MLIFAFSSPTNIQVVFKQLAKISLLGILFFSACVPKKKMVYLQGEESSEVDSIKTFAYQKTDYRLQENDIIDVQVVSLLPEVNEIFSGKIGNNNQQSFQVGAQAGDLYYVTGYSVDKNGNVSLPIIGDVRVEGLTMDSVRIVIDEEVQNYFSKYYLTVKLGGIRYSALGEFNRPGKYIILQNQATIFEAISNAGDLNMVASRNDVKLIRQYPEGTRIHEINLLDESIISSPFYFIQPNDVLYVEPLPQKSWGLGVTGAQTIVTVITALSTSVALILAIQGLNN